MAHWIIGKPEDKCNCIRCGSENVALWNDTGTWSFWMQCRDCGAEGHENSAFGAVRAWQPRLTPPFLKLDRVVCEGILAKFSPEYPMVVTPAYYQKLKDAGLPLKNVVESTPCKLSGDELSGDPPCGP